MVVCFGVVFCCLLVWCWLFVGWLCGCVVLVVGGCDTPVGVLFLLGFGVVGVGWVCVLVWLGVCFSFAAAWLGWLLCGLFGLGVCGGLRTQECVCTTL